MLDRSHGHHRVVRLFALAALLALVFLVPRAATATTQTKFFSASATWSASPGFVGVADTATVTLGNELASTQSFGSAELTFNSVPPGAVQVVQNSLPAGWSAQVLKGTPAVVLLTNQSGSAIPPGSSLRVQVKVTPPAAGTLTIVAVVKQSNDFSGAGNLFILDGSSGLSLTVIALTLQFSQQPSSTIGQSLPNAPYFAYFCNPISVQIYNNAGPVGASGVPITINYAGNSNPGLYYGPSAVTSSGVTVDTDSSGLATFGSCGSGVATTVVGNGFALSASSAAAAAPVTSTTFQVLQTCIQSCMTNQTSQTTGTTGAVSASDKGNFFQIFTAFGRGVNLNCDSAVTTPGFPVDPLFVETQAVAGAVSGTLTFVFPKSVVNSLTNNGTPLMPVCAGALKPFLANVPYPGSAAYPNQGLLYNCDDPTYLASAGQKPLQLCVQSRAKIGGGAEQIVVFASNLSDPGFW
jgi:hypothetical protein